MKSVDIVIAGGGMIGLALACGLQDTGLSVALLEKNAQQPQSIALIDQALRVSAINLASAALLEYIGVWEEILAQGASFYTSMEVWDKDSFGKIFFHAQEQGFHHLGCIIDHEVIRQSLWNKAIASNHIRLLAPASFEQVAWGDNEAFITLTDGRLLSARLVVGADGADSWLRQYSGIPITFWDYDHHALVAVVHTEQTHQQTARQIFNGGEGILAFLPLEQAHLSFIVWSLPATESAHFLKMPEKEFNKALSVAFDTRLGLCQLQGQRQIFPLKARYARDFAAHRLALVGDAAHTIHPLAGQGVNLGFMDVAALISEIHRLKMQGKDIGHYPYLRRYERQRKQSSAFMLAAMEGLGALFSGDKPLKKWIRNAGISLIDKLPTIKSRLIYRAMGLDEMPSFLKKSDTFLCS